MQNSILNCLAKLKNKTKKLNIDTPRCLLYSVMPLGIIKFLYFIIDKTINKVGTKLVKEV